MMVTLAFFIILPVMWQIPICLITAELTTTLQVSAPRSWTRRWYLRISPLLRSGLDRLDHHPDDRYIRLIRIHCTGCPVKHPGGFAPALPTLL